MADQVFRADPLESLAARIVEASSGVGTKRLPEGKQQPDFELISDTGRLGVLEVTSRRSEARAEFYAATAKHRANSPSLAKHWSVVTARTNLNIAKLMPQLLAALGELEAQSSRSMIEIQHPQTRLWFANGISTEMNSKLHQLGITLLLSSGRAQPGSPANVIVQPPAFGGFIGPQAVTQEVHSVLHRPDNLTKLSMVSDGERSELFVWLLDGIGALAMNTPIIAPTFADGYPTDGPRLPPPVTAVWVANGPSESESPARAVWYSNGDRWQILDTSELTNDAQHTSAPTLH